MSSCCRRWHAPRVDVPDSVEVEHVCALVLDHVEPCRCKCGAGVHPPEDAVDMRTDDAVMSGDRMWTLSRADGDLIGGDYEFYSAADADDWSTAVDEMIGAGDDDDDAEPVEFVIEEWVKVRTHHRTIAPIPAAVDRANFGRGRSWRNLLDEYTVDGS